MHFETALRYILENEGGFVDDPDDRGGATNMGITEAALSRWRARKVSRGEIQALTREEVAKIYKKFYWDPLGLDSCPDAAIATAIFDVCVNMGVGRAGTIIHAALRAIPGDQTIATVERREFLAKFIAEFQDRYVDIVLQNLSQLKFLRGWINRSQRMIGLMV